MDRIKDTWDVGKEIYEHIRTIEYKEEIRQILLADLLDHIGRLMEDTYHKLSTGIYPTGNSERLEVFSHQLQSMLSPLLGESQARVLAKKLERAYTDEFLYGLHHSRNLDPDELKILELASRYFLEAAQRLRASGEKKPGVLNQFSYRS